jgi:hypothetical protein
MPPEYPLIRAGHGVSARAIVCTVLASLVFFSRAWLIRTGGSPMPFWDQWDAEALNLYLPWLNGNLRWTSLFQAHNEHRILFTRLADLALFVVWSRWDTRAELLFNAILHAAAAATLAAIFWSANPPRARTVFMVGLALLFTATCGWQNALWGFQSQVYLTNLFTIGAIAGLCQSTPQNRNWWLGLIAGCLALFTTGGGLLVSAATLMVGVLGLRRTPDSARTLPTLVMIAAVLILGIVLTPSTPWHVPLHAKTVGQFFAVFTQCLAWPWVNDGIFCFVMQLPLAALIFIRWRKHESLDPAERCALALGLFSILHAAAVAYSRGGGLIDARPLSRYQDPLLLGVTAQLFAVMRLGVIHARPTRIALLLWGGIALAGLIGLTETNLTVHLPYKRNQDQASLAMTRAYVATGDPSVFTREAIFSGPHPDPRVVQRVLDDPKLRAIMPVELLSAEIQPITASLWLIQFSPILTAIAGAMFLAGLVCSLRSTPAQTSPAGTGNANSTALSGSDSDVPS